MLIAVSYTSNVLGCLAAVKGMQHRANLCIYEGCKINIHHPFISIPCSQRGKQNICIRWQSKYASWLRVESPWTLSYEVAATTNSQDVCGRPLKQANKPAQWVPCPSHSALPILSARWFLFGLTLKVDRNHLVIHEGSFSGSTKLHFDF